jgi:hypothetical protein
MTSEARRALQVLASALPEGVSVPVPREWLLELLSGENETALTAVASADLTVADLAKRFGRQTSTVRAWLERGMFPGAYKFMGGREWRVPLQALSAFETGQRKGTPQSVAGCTAGKPFDLGAWRRAPEAA